MLALARLADPDAERLLLLVSDEVLDDPFPTPFAVGELRVTPQFLAAALVTGGRVHVAKDRLIRCADQVTPFEPREHFDVVGQVDLQPAKRRLNQRFSQQEPLVLSCCFVLY